MSRRGANAIDLALCMPVFALLVAGLVDFGWLFFHRAAVGAAAQKGCRAGALVDPIRGDPEGTAATAMVSALLANGVPCGDSCATSVLDVGTEGKRTLICRLSIHFHPLVGVLARDMPLSATAEAPFEWQRGPAAISSASP